MDLETITRKLSRIAKRGEDEWTAEVEPRLFLVLEEPGEFGDQYKVYFRTEILTDSKLIDLEVQYAGNVKDAVEKFKLYHMLSRKKHIHPEFLPSYGKWRKNKEGHLIIFPARRSMQVGNNNYGTIVQYKGMEADENVVIQKGKIADVMTLYRLFGPQGTIKMDFRSAKTFHNIKEHEEDLRKLPAEIQPDLQAIYRNGKGQL